MDDKLDEMKVNVICHVCGTRGAQTHYGGICCVSCKMFFRRNAQYDLNANRCVFNEKCDITINSRRACRYCRLQKCLDIGMQRELLRASHQRQHRPSTINLCQQQKILANQQSSLLTDEQWCRLSNIINTYDTKSPVSQIQTFLSNQSKQPMKIRLKMSKTNILEIIMSLYQSILPFLEVLPEFQSMQTFDRCQLIERNLSRVGAFSGIVVFRESGVTFSEAFQNGYPLLYGSNIVEDSITIARRTDSDLTLIKLLIPVILFSTANSLSNTNEQNLLTNPNSIFSNTEFLFKIQNIYADILFKYMTYQFGYFEAAMRFAALIKSFLDQGMCIERAASVQEIGRAHV